MRKGWAIREQIDQSNGCRGVGKAKGRGVAWELARVGKERTGYKAAAHCFAAPEELGGGETYKVYGAVSSEAVGGVIVRVAKELGDR